MPMKCPNCYKPIPDKEINRHFASQGGKARKNRTITPEHQAKLQAGKKAKREKDIRQEGSL